MRKETPSGFPEAGSRTLPGRHERGCGIFFSPRRQYGFFKGQAVKTDESGTVVVVGASDNPERYANMAVRLLKSHGYEVIPVNPELDEVEGIPVVHRLNQIRKKVRTVTLYVGPSRSAGMAEDLIALSPGRVIFNPGTEVDILERKLRESGIDTVRACTLVLLNSGRF